MQACAWQLLAPEKPAEFSIRAPMSRLERPRDYTETMSSRPRPGAPRAPGSAVPEPLSIATALSQHSGLARLGLLMRESARRMEVVRVALPGALVRFVSAGPLDEEGWTMLAANAAVAAKLRQLQPRLEMLLQEQGLMQGKLRIKVQQH